VNTVINVPSSLDDQGFEKVVEQLSALPADAPVLIDARHARWGTPFGLTAMLTLGQSRATKAQFSGPENEDVASYWARTGFYKHAEGVFQLVGHVPRGRTAGESEVLLEVTPVAHSEDVHNVVARIQHKAQAILTNLHIDSKATMGFAMTLSEACQNIIEHAGTGGWVAVQVYEWRKRLGRRVVVIAVCDAGQGFRRSLEGTHGRRIGDRWGDAAALEEAVLRAQSRFTDKGRGQGLAGIRRYVGRWDGKLTVRSGTARLSINPSWDDDVPLTKNLPAFPGAQMQIVIPERLTR
jgi:hypothetical protein